jgi:hypothetical protein
MLAEAAVRLEAATSWLAYGLLGVCDLELAAAAAIRLNERARRWLELGMAA